MFLLEAGKFFSCENGQCVFDMHVLTVDIFKWPHLEPAACILISLHDQKKMQKNEI